MASGTNEVALDDFYGKLRFAQSRRLIWAKMSKDLNSSSRLPHFKIESRGGDRLPATQFDHSINAF
jgi:hypothetical protein